MNDPLQPNAPQPNVHGRKQSSEFSELERLFLILSALPRDQQPEKLIELCSDPNLREKVKQLLEADSPHDELLDHSLIPKPIKLNIGERVGHYQLLKQIGEGGMGYVYMAEQLEPVRRNVALKVIKPGVDTREVIARFEAERQALSIMDHPNIAKVLDAGTTATGHPFFVMELVNGLQITDYCDLHQLQTTQRLELFTSVCGAIQHAHQKGIIHRDIKPSNVLVAEYDGRPIAKVIDFGVAKAINQTLTNMTVHTSFGQILGTFEYMSPEQTRVNQMDVDTRSDIYSLGVLLYELLTGTTPFDKERLRSATWEEMLKIIREEDPPVPSIRRSTKNKQRLQTPSLSDMHKEQGRENAKLSRTLRSELDWIVMKAMEKDRERRYQSPNSLARDIERFMQGDAVTACPPSRRYRFRKFAKRNKVALTMIAAVAISLLFGMAGTSWQAIRATHAEAEAANSALKADSVNKFLVNDLLGLAGAESQMSAGLRPDPNLKLIALLDRALGEVDGRFAGQPQVAALLKETLANSCVSVGRYDDAARLYGEFLMYLLQERGKSHPDTIRAMRQLAIVQIYRSRLAEAETICKQAIEAMENTEPGQHDLEFLMLQLKSTRATVYQKQKRYSEALAEHKECMESKRRLLVKDHPEVCYTMSILAELHESLNQFEEAESLHSEVLQIRRRQFSGSHPLVAASLHDLGRCYLKRGQAASENKYFALSEPLLTECFKTYFDVRGEDHPDTLASQSSLTQLYCESGKFNDAQLLLKDLVGRLERTAPDQLQNLEARNALGWTLLQTGKLAEAENTLTLAQESCKQLNMEDDLPIVRRVKGNLAIAYQRLGKLEQSIFLDEELSVATTRVLGRNHIDTLASKARLGLSKLEIGQVKAGQELLMAVFEDGQHVPEAFKIATLLANSFAKQRDAEQVAIWTKREVESARINVPVGSVQLAEILAASGTRLLGVSKWGEAEVILRECLEFYLSKDSEPSTVCVMQSQLGHALAAQNKFQAALPHLIAGYEGRKDRSPNRQSFRSVYLKTTLEKIIACCDALKQAEYSAKYRSELTKLRTTR